MWDAAFLRTWFKGKLLDLPFATAPSTDWLSTRKRTRHSLRSGLREQCRSAINQVRASRRFMCPLLFHRADGRRKRLLLK